jgi:membrane-associated phospholipid phosphatase
VSRHTGGRQGTMLYLADPDVRLLLGLAGLAAAGLPVHDHRLGPREESVFRAVNELPDGLYRPTWLIMQSGNLVAVPLAAALARLSGRRALALRLAVGGVTSWALAKVIKRIYRRPRPGSLVAGARCRGAEASGLGYVSGHAGVAVTLAVAAFPELGPAGRLATLVVVPTVGLCRIYVGAHLPLDVLGGAAMGLAVDGVVARVLRPRECRGAATRGRGTSARSGLRGAGRR